MKENPDRDDPARPSPQLLHFKARGTSGRWLLALVAVPPTIQEILSESVFLLLFLVLALGFSALRAAYGVASAGQMAWERRSTDEIIALDTPQKYTLSLLQRLTMLIALLLGARMTWHYLTLGHLEAYGWVPLLCLAGWIWADAIVRYYAGRHAAGFTQTVHPVVRPLMQLMTPLNHYLTKVGSKWKILLADETTKYAENLDNQAENEEERDLLRGLVTFGQTAARQAMQPRLNITAVDVELDFHELMDKINKSGYSRIPAYDDTLDSVEGILYVKDLLPHLHRDEHFAWQKLLRKAYFIPESKRLDDLMQEFQNRRVHMAIVVDEYGGTNGLITLEDIIEEIFGDINDEYDEAEEVKYTQVDEKTYIFEGKVLINDFCKLLSLEPDYFEEVRHTSESLGGLLLELFSQLPRTGEQVTHRDLTFKIQSADKKRIKKVRVIMA